MFQLYLEHGSVRQVAEQLARDGTRLPVRQRLGGSGSIGGGLFTRGQLYKILSNRIYIGRIPHGATTYPGLHPIIAPSG